MVFLVNIIMQLFKVIRKFIMEKEIFVLNFIEQIC